MSVKILDELIAAKVSSETILAVAKMIAECETAGRIRAQNAERQRRHRDRNVTSRDGHVTSRDPPHVYTTPPKKIDSKRNLSMPIPEDFSPDLSFAASKGWAKERAEAEAQRFRDHALSKGRKAKDWNAAWRNWVTSPYNGVANGHSEKSVSAACGRLAEAAERGEFTFGPRPSLLPAESSSDVRVLSKGRGE